MPNHPAQAMFTESGEIVSIPTHKPENAITESQGRLFDMPVNTKREEIVGDLELIVNHAKAYGYTHVSTHGGWIDLDDWTPYGLRKHEHVWFVLHYYEASNVWGIKELTKSTHPQGMLTGLWSLGHHAD